VDSQRFDGWTRALAGGTSRRTVLKGLVGGAFVGIAGLRQTGAQDDGSGEQGDLGDPCSEVLTCGPGLVCADGVCAAADGSGEQGDLGDPCSEVLTCGPGLVCVEGVCATATDGSGEQGDLGDPCSEVLTCGPGLVCSNGYCTEATTLPVTGVGATAGAGGQAGGSWLIPAALAGTATVVLRRLRGIDPSDDVVR
jgi:hypothetical protein